MAAPYPGGSVSPGLRFMPRQAGAGLQYRPLSAGRSVAAGGLAGIGQMLMALAAGQPQQAAAAFQGGLQGFEEGQYRQQQQADYAEDREYRRQERADVKAERAAKADQDAAARVMFEDSVRAMNLPPEQEAFMLAQGPGGVDYKDLFPKATGPESSLGKLKADLDAGLIDRPTYDALVAKETALPQGPQDPERVRVAKEAGLVPGSPEYRQFLLGTEGPLRGNGLDQQMYNIVLTGDPSTPEYAAAYANLAMPKVSFDAVTGKSVIVQPDLSWARKPSKAAGAVAEPRSKDDQAGVSTMQVPGATVTSTPGAPIFNETQGKAAGFADRIAASNPILDSATAAGTDLVQQGLSAVPNALGRNYMISGDRQKFEQAERDFINAILRRESGAVISEEEFANARQQYIPQPGDDADTVAQKKSSRERALASMQREGGPFYKPKGAADANDPLGIRKKP